MNRIKDVCTLEYLAGTLATAYKGVITSLVARDFCVKESAGRTALTGTILSIPEGDYKASLIHEGREIARTELRDGTFELGTDTDIMSNARNLQIDIIQNGRHIGTFLLKRETTDGLFSSAIELSDDIRGTNFRMLAASLQSRPGLLKRAEDIITKIHSTKKDWLKFSEEVNSFSKDLFWSDRTIYAEWYQALVRQAVNACIKQRAPENSKPVSNLLSHIELPLDNEGEPGVLGSLVRIWLRETERKPIDYSCRFSQALRVLLSIHEKFPAEDCSDMITSLLASVKARIGENPVIRDSVVAAFKNVLPASDISMIAGFSEKAGQEMLSHIAGLQKLFQKGNQREFFAAAGGSSTLQEIGSVLAGEGEVVNVFLGVIERNLDKDSAEVLMNAVYETFPDLNALSPDAYKSFIRNIPPIIKKLAELNLAGECDSLLERVAGWGSPGKEEIILNTQVASALMSAKKGWLLEKYSGMLKQIIVPAPKVRGFSPETWAEIVDPRHVERLSKFMEIISLDGEKFRAVLVHLVCNVYVTGVFIPDDRLFQRQVSAYLNSGAVRSNFFLSSLLLRKLPVYFHEVGATGRLRDDTTELDSWGNDPVLYFLRKQVHVNGSNYNTNLVETIISSWFHGDPDLLRTAVPRDVVERLDGSLLSRYSSALRSFLGAAGVLDEGLRIEKIAELSDAALNSPTEFGDPEAGRKVALLCMIYRELVRKYLNTVDRPDQTVSAGLTESLAKMSDLKKIFLSPEITRADESLYFKRHIAFGIPSVMGSYHERKFDALSGFFRIEERLRIVFEKELRIINDKGKKFSADDVRRWGEHLHILNGLSALQGLGNFEADEFATILRTNALFLSQISDVLGMWRRELAWTVDSFYETFHGPLTGILRSLPQSDLPERLTGGGAQEADLSDRVTDVILRDMVNAIPGFQELDRMITALLTTYRRSADLTIEPANIQQKSREFYNLDELSDEEAARLAPLIGSKAKNLVYLQKKGILVPPGIIFPADKTNRDTYLRSPEFIAVLKSGVAEIEKRTGAVYGGIAEPLFLSVRSGSYPSMPGILASVLYCGMNPDTLAAFIKKTGRPRLGWDSYRTFIEHYCAVVYGQDMEFFENITHVVLKKYRCPHLDELGHEGMEEIVSRYFDEMKKKGLIIPGDVYIQLKECVRGVYRSWLAEKAMQFRRAVGISEHWGTAVAVMQMICGNDEGAGASVFFTRTPFTLERKIYGDTRERATGAAIVYGNLVNRPLSKAGSRAGRESLEEADPELFRIHEALGAKVEEALGGLPQEVEITYTTKPDGEKVFSVLQARRMEFRRGFLKRFDDACRMEANIIGRGAGVHGGALSGVATLSQSSDDIRRLRERTGMPLILLRSAADTGDVALMAEVQGIVTSAGGVSSHAAVLAQRFDLTAVVGCTDMEISTDERGVRTAVLGGYAISEGSPISIDGSLGLVYSGLCKFTVDSRE